MTSPDPSSAVSPGWSDNVPLDQLNTSLSASAAARAASAQANTDQQFWSTPARPATSPVKEVMEITLSTPRMINRLDFQIANFPHTVLLEYYDDQLADWLPAVSSLTTSPEPVRETMLDSVPGAIPPANAISGHLHPQHSYSGHWHETSMRIRPIRARRLRLVLARTTQGSAPRNTLGQLIDYSLGINNLSLGYQVASKADVPRTAPLSGSFTETQPFAATSDILGSAVNYSIRTNKASNVLQNATGASSAKLIWKSEPQPFPWAVVNFYVDGRDADGQAQVIDRFFLEPVTEGPHLNLYYSNDEPSGDFSAGDDPLPPNVGVISGKSGAVNVLGQSTVGQVNFVDINNTAIGFNPGRAWWLGAELTFNFVGSQSNENRPIFDCPQFSIAMTPLGLRVTTAYSDHVLISTQDFNSSIPVRFLVAYDGERELSLHTLVNDERIDDVVKLSVPLDDATIDSMRVGGFQGSNPGSGSFRLTSMVIKVSETPGEELIEAYLDDPTPYAIKPVLAADDDGLTNNAILRYDPTSSSVDYPSGFVGGPPDHYADMEWSPIARDYILRKGFLYLPPTKAKYWKLEFCNLVPSPHEVYVPVKRTVKTYSTQMWSRPPVMTSVSYTSISFRYAFTGVRSSINLSTSLSYKSQTKIKINNSGVKVYSKTSVRIVNDISVQKQIGKAYWAFNFVSWHATTWVPRFERVCVHTYDKVEVEQKTKIGYFVGLQRIEAYRLNYLAVDDTAQYVEMFHDKTNISPDSNWQLLDTHQLTSGDSKFAQVDSRPIPTNKMIRAVQFAAVQTPPRQILPDDDFDAETPDYWQAVGDGHLASNTTEVDILGSVLRVDRSPHPLDWGTLQTAPGTWGAFESRGLTYRLVEQLGNPAGQFGGVQSRLYDTPPGGRVHVAARCVTPKDLSHPLYVQLVDQSDRVLAESGTTVRSGQVAEWYTSYTLGEGGKILAYRWADFAVPPGLARFVDSFDHADSAVLQLMDSGQAWEPAMSGTTVLSHAISGNEAVQNASATAIDSFRADTIWGAFEWVMGTMGTGAQVPLVSIEPFNLSDQGILTFRGGTVSGLPTGSVFGRALVSGDVCHVDVMPTKFVPSARRDPSAPIDDVSAPYSLVFFLNGAWTSTVSHRLGARHRRSIQGRAGQRIRSMFWTPADYAQPLGQTLWRLPVAALGGSYDAVGSTWTDGGGHTWAKLGAWDNSGSRLVALSTGAQYRIETDTWYGILHARVHNVARGNAANPLPHGPVLVLDAENGVTVDAFGYLMKDGTAWTRLFPSGIANDSNISVQFADTKQVNYSVRGQIDANATPRMLIARVNGAVVGVWGSTKLGEWSGTSRGLGGDPYNNGFDSDGNPVALPTGGVAGDLCTSFDTFDWAPDTSTVSAAPNAPTWDDVTKRGTATYAQASQSQLLEPNRFRARLVQKGASNDLWEVDTLSMFVEPVVWYFSNDGGTNFYPAYDIRNNPQGVLTFPQQDPAQPYNPAYGQQLVWRAVSYSPNQNVSSLVIRPWYAGLISGITHRTGVFSGDPNVMPYDHYPDLEQDARFQTWNLPIPQEWWYASRILERSKDAPVESTPIFTLPDTLISDGGPR